MMIVWKLPLSTLNHISTVTPWKKHDDQQTYIERSIKLDVGSPNQLLLKIPNNQLHNEDETLKSKHVISMNHTSHSSNQVFFSFYNQIFSYTIGV